MLTFDAEAYAEHRGVMNADGSRGYARGVRIVACPYCCNDDGKAWINVERGTAGCFHASCELGSGAIGLVRWAQRAEGFRSRTQTELWLEQEFPGVTVQRRVVVPERPADWVKWPDGTRWFQERGGFQAGPGRTANNTNGGGRGILYDEAAAFLRRQWGLTLRDAERWGWGFCAQGRYAWRIVIPVVQGGTPVQFQARSYRVGEPKYLSGKEGIDAARGMGEVLYNVDAVGEGSNAILVEGAADVVALSREPHQPAVGAGAPGDRPGGAGGLRGAGGAVVLSGQGVAVGLLGSQLSAAQAALLAAQRPAKVTVALDADAERTTRMIAEQLRGDWGLVTEAATWHNGKDAASGGRIVLLSW